MGLPQIKEISKRGKKFRLRKDQHGLSAIRDWQNQLEISKDHHQESSVQAENRVIKSKRKKGSPQRLSLDLTPYHQSNLHKITIY
jgi:hypothetical protein